MVWRWEFWRDEHHYSMARGKNSDAVLALAFLNWLDGRDVSEINKPSALAGFLAAHSDLSRRELAGLLGTFRFEPPSGTELEFSYQGERIWIDRDRV